MTKDVLLYKSFVGSVHFSTDEEIFFGKIEGIVDLITFEGTSVQSLKKSFHEAVDAYIKYCNKHKKPLVKSLKGTFNVRIKPETHQQAAYIAALQGISLNQLVQNAIEREISKAK